jgi:hypothetical protein
MVTVEGEPDAQLVDPDDDDLAMIQILDPRGAPVFALRPLEALDFAVRIVNAAADAMSGERHLVVNSGLGSQP